MPLDFGGIFYTKKTQSNKNNYVYTELPKLRLLWYGLKYTLKELNSFLTNRGKD